MLPFTLSLIQGSLITVTTPPPPAPKKYPHYHLTPVALNPVSATSDRPLRFIRMEAAELLGFCFEVSGVLPGFGLRAKGVGYVGLQPRITIRVLP